MTDGTKEGFVFSIDMGPFSGGQLLPKVILEGSFEETGKGVNGEIALRMGMEQGDTSLTVAIGKLTVSDLIVTEKTLSGSLTMSFDSGLGQMIPVDGDSASILQMLLGTQIRCTFSSDEKENTGTVEVISDGKKLISLSSSVTVDDQASVTVPSEAVTVEEYVASVDMQKFAERAEQLGLNEKVLEVIKSLISAGEF